MFISREHVIPYTNHGQIGLIVLAIIVTRSSALSIQSKAGLPRGNQIVGWIVFGE